MNRHKLNDKCENKNIKDLRMVLPMFHINLKPCHCLNIAYFSKFLRLKSLKFHMEGKLDFENTFVAYYWTDI